MVDNMRWIQSIIASVSILVLLKAISSHTKKTSITTQKPHPHLSSAHNILPHTKHVVRFGANANTNPPAPVSSAPVFHAHNFYPGLFYSS